MELLDNKTPQFQFDNIYGLILAVMPTNKEELVKVDWCVAISANDEDENIFLYYLFCIFPIYIPNRHGIRWK